MQKFLARTSVLAAFIFAGSGLINSAIYVAVSFDTSNTTFRHHWIEVETNRLATRRLVTVL